MSKLPRIGKLAKYGLALLFWAVAPLAGAGADDAASSSGPTGLMWNRTGLPAVFPLQVKTPEGQDYFLKLIEDDTGKEALAAFINGGAFFKILVPPGTFRLTFAAGDVWQDEENLFGHGGATRFFELDNPLTFEIRSRSVKAGHLVTIPDPGSDPFLTAAVKDQFICQSLRMEFPSSIYQLPDHGFSGDLDHRGWVRTETGHLIYVHDDFVGPRVTPAHPEYRFSPPQTALWSHYCG